MRSIISKAVAALALLTFGSGAFAQGPGGGGPGPQPVPSPWVVSGSQISYNGCVNVPASVSGGCKGNGTINATAIYQAGFQVLGTLANGAIFVGNASAVGIARIPSGDLTISNAGVFTIGANVVNNAKSAQMNAVTIKGNPTNALANASDYTIQGLTALGSPSSTLDFLLIYDHVAGTLKNVTPAALSTASGGITALTGDVTATGPGSVAATLATVNANVGTFGSATQSVQFTVNGKGLITAAANVTVTPAVGSITGLGTGVATALGVNVGSAGAVVINAGALGTPSSGVATNLTGTASGLTAGTVTTNANMTGDVTSVGNASTIAANAVTNAKSAQMAAYTFKGNVTGSTANATDFTIAGLTNKTVPAGGDLIILADSASSNATKYATLTQALGAVTSGVSSIAGNTGVFTLSGGITNSTNDIRLANIAANTVYANATSGSAAPTAYSMPSCSTSNSALNYTTNTGIGCGANFASLTATAQVLSGGATITAFSIGTVPSGTTTISAGNGPYQWMVNTGASTIAAPTSLTSGLDVQVINGNAAGAITLSGFAASPTGTGDTFATANTASGTATFSNGSANIGFTNTLIAGQKVYFTTSGGLPTNFTANTIYYVIATSLSTSNIQVAATPGGSAIVAGSAGSGTQTAHLPSVFLLIVNQVDGLATAFWKQQQ